MRLAKFLAGAGIVSRRKAEEMISQGRVRVNGKIVTLQGTTINPDYDIVELDNQVLETERKAYILLYKPAGYICSLVDPQGRPTVADLLRGLEIRVYPVGRLDYDTSGLLLMTNDGDFANLMTHPRYGIKKKYRAELRGRISRKAIQQLRQGVLLEDGLTAPASVKLIKSDAQTSQVEIEIGEGKKREVRRMCAAVGFPVNKLQRVAIGFLSLRGLKPGRYRFLTPDEVERLKAGAGINKKNQKPLSQL